MTSPADVAPRNDLHWLAVRLFQDLGTAELPAVQQQGLSLWGYEALRTVRHQPAPNQLALARALGIDKNRMVAIVDELQDAGLVERTADPGDRRNRCIQITRAGRQLCDATMAELDRIEARALTVLPAQRRSKFISDLQHVIDALAALGRDQPN